MLAYNPRMIQSGIGTANEGALARRTEGIVKGLTDLGKAHDEYSRDRRSRNLAKLMSTEGFQKLSPQEMRAEIAAVGKHNITEQMQSSVDNLLRDKVSAKAAKAKEVNAMERLGLEISANQYIADESNQTRKDISKDKIASDQDINKRNVLSNEGIKKRANQSALTNLGMQLNANILNNENSNRVKEKVAETRAKSLIDTTRLNNEAAMRRTLVPKHRLLGNGLIFNDSTGEAIDYSKNKDINGLTPTGTKSKGRTANGQKMGSLRLPVLSGGTAANPGAFTGPKYDQWKKMNNAHKRMMYYIDQHDQRFNFSPIKTKNEKTGKLETTGWEVVNRGGSDMTIEQLCNELKSLEKKPAIDKLMK